MKRIFKIASLLLAAVLCAGAMFACGGEKPDSYNTVKSGKYTLAGGDMWYLSYNKDGKLLERSTVNLFVPVVEGDITNRYIYDENGRFVSHIYNGAELKVVYDGDTVYSKGYYLGTLVHIEYTVVSGRIMKETIKTGQKPNSIEESYFIYDSDGNITESNGYKTVTDGSKVQSTVKLSEEWQVELVFDEKGKPLHIAYPSGNTLMRWYYDEKGNLINSSGYPLHTSDFKGRVSTAIEYKSGRVSSVKSRGSDSANALIESQTDFEYEKNGDIKRMTVTESRYENVIFVAVFEYNNGLIAKKNTTVYQGDGKEGIPSLITETKYNDRGDMISAVSDAYSEEDVLRDRTEKTYTYNELGASVKQATAAMKPDGSELYSECTEYAYDKDGNIITVSYFLSQNYKDDNCPTWTTMNYDGNGVLTRTRVDVEELEEDGAVKRSEKETVYRSASSVSKIYQRTLINGVVVADTTTENFFESEDSDTLLYSIGTSNTTNEYNLRYYNSNYAQQSVTKTYHPSGEWEYSSKRYNGDITIEEYFAKKLPDYQTVDDFRTYGRTLYEWTGKYDSEGVYLGKDEASHTYRKDGTRERTEGTYYDPEGNTVNTYVITYDIEGNTESKTYYDYFKPQA